MEFDWGWGCQIGYLVRRDPNSGLKAYPALHFSFSILLVLSPLFLMFAKTYTSLQKFVDTFLNLSICMLLIKTIQPLNKPPI